MIASLLLGTAQITADFDSKSTLTRLVASDFGRCLVRKKPDVARRAVVEDWDSPAMHSQQLITSDCLIGGVLAIKPLLLKASMAAALMEADVAGATPETIKLMPPLFYRGAPPMLTIDQRGRALSRRKLVEQQERQQSWAEWTAIAQFGECVVRAEPTAVPALATSVPNTKTEIASLKPFGPHLGNCLRKGVRMEIDRGTLRATLTLAYYRLAMAAKSSATTPGATR